ncbi:diguanylate cyclase/phosphodiesterase (GGDEF & EAL domains) with PAS/PAC sensor(s) [hydrothermal vent metagenome]|uniref:Diguanylate cyclase/phosphodiesterase (GGDEF & EAL domains) with PAS/PAC sensor(S) n=1 Tax=hydrothermal vent metagenome TaxID=652676 RepID=A0A3B0ZF42_9ZZZZ
MKPSTPIPDNDLQQWHELTLELLTAMGDMYGSPNQCRDINSILSTSLDHIKRTINFKTLAILTIDEKDASFKLANWKPASHQKQLQHQVDLLIESGKFAWAIQQNRPVAIESEKSSEPIIMHVLTTKTRVRGMFVGISAVPFEQLSATRLNLLSIISHNCAHALESATLYNLIQQQNRSLSDVVDRRNQELEYRMGHDSLTGLPNRMLFQDRIEQAISNARRHKTKFAVLLLDIDLFSRINESMGHRVGDELLKAIANRLNNILRNSDTVGRPANEMSQITISRLGGDEFSLLITDLEKVDNIISVVRRIFEVISTPFSLQGQEVFITLSIGIALFPTDSEETGALLQKSDVAMHHAKEEGRNNYQFYSEDISSISHQHLVIESQLRHAVENREFKLFYQPKIDLKTQSIIGAEALIRWIKSDGSIIPPFDFIPIAENSGQIVKIGEWVLQDACRQAKVWLDMGIEQKIAVNLSAQQFKDKQLLNKIESALSQSQLPPSLLELEITESTIMQNSDRTISTLQAIHDLGVSLSIDDFGTGYSSLSYLKRFPIDTLKIDRSFVKDLEHDQNDAAIVTAIIALAHSLHLNVVAEGVEEVVQVAFLRKLNCEMIQGFLYSKPLPADEYLALLKRPIKKH